MRDQIWDYLFDEGFLPHGTCLLWNPTLFWAHALSDAVIAASYFSIPIVLAAFAFRRRDFQYRWLLNLFGLFIVLCGLSHAFGIWTLWVPAYAAEALVKILTAIVSAATAVLLWPLLPRIVAIPSVADLERQNLLLEQEIRRHHETQAKLSRFNEDLEDKVKERTADLEAKTTQLEGLRHAAEAANDAKSRFLSMVSHEIRTPLNSVINMSGLLLEKTRDLTDRRYISTISSASKALLSIVQDILDFSQIEAGQVSFKNTPTDVGEVIEEVVESTAPMAHQRGLDIAAYIAPTVPRIVVTDEGRVRQILLNLVGNAVNYTLRGSVEVRVDWQGDMTQGTLAIDVIDTGIGIAPHDQEAIFDRFTLAGAEHPGTIRGTGLGLSICRRLASEMGGQISVGNSPGHGTTFRLRLPTSVGEGSVPQESDIDAVIFSDASTTARLMRETLADMGRGTDLVPFNPAQDPGANSRKDIALVLAPIDLSDPMDCQTACAQAGRWAEQVLLLLPIGASSDLHTTVAAAGISARTYPVRRNDLRSRRTLLGLDAKETAIPVPDLGGLSILVIDDNDDNLFVADHVLSRAGATVRWVNSGESGLIALATEEFDCILLDLRMPGMDGFETARRIRASGPAGEEARIVAVSASADPATLERLAVLGVTDYLAKPYMPEDLWSTVLDVVDRSPSADQTASARSPHPPRESGMPVLDPSFIEQIAEFAGADLLMDRIDHFLAALPQRLARIENGDPMQQADEVHALAGASGSLGLITLSAECRKLESRLREAGALPLDGAAIPELAQTVSAARDALIGARNRLSLDGTPPPSPSARK
ncbi:MAG: ATP-binding protein [Thalassobaculaceae bacterium]|nr:ATP-binding protein [Thalassobaculaceae bacterium]